MNDDARSVGGDADQTNGTLSRRSFLSGAGVSAALLALDAIVRRHGGAEAAALRSQIAAAAAGEQPPVIEATWQNWSQNLSSNPEQVFSPLNQQDLVDVIAQARNAGKRIRVRAWPTVGSSQRAAMAPAGTTPRCRTSSNQWTSSTPPERCAPIRRPPLTPRR